MFHKCYVPCVYTREGFNNNIITLDQAEIPNPQAKILYFVCLFVLLFVCLFVFGLFIQMTYHMLKYDLRPYYCFPIGHLTNLFLCSALSQYVVFSACLSVLLFQLAYFLITKPHHYISTDWLGWLQLAFSTDVQPHEN